MALGTDGLGSGDAPAEPRGTEDHKAGNDGPPDDRVHMVTMRSAELSVYDIGDALGCTPQYVSQELGRARKTIERFLK